MNVATRQETAARDQTLARVIERIGVLTRDFAASGTYPFKSRGLTRAQMNAMFVLSRAEESSVADLAAKLHVTSGAVSQTVDALKAQGLVTSDVNEADRRGRVIRLTAGARVEVDAFERAYLDAIAPRFDSLALEDIAELDRILSQVSVSDIRERS
ncbi:MAG: MarR family transcriptional regulator [Salinibacterium sp.]|nr:MarR family transcriptional regulator [Salinibacterium sp.]